MRLLALTVTLLLAVSGSSDAITLMVNGDTPSARYQRILDGSYVPLPDVTVDLALLDDATDACGGGGPACVAPAADGANAQMWLTKGTAADDVVHEAAHVFDYAWMTDADRARFLAWMGERRAWRGAPDSPHERFASLVEACMRGPRYMQRQVRRTQYVRSIRGFKPIYDFGYGLVLWPKKAAEGCPLVQQVAARNQP